MIFHLNLRFQLEINTYAEICAVKPVRVEAIGFKSVSIDANKLETTHMW